MDLSTPTYLLKLPLSQKIKRRPETRFPQPSPGAHANFSYTGNEKPRFEGSKFTGSFTLGTATRRRTSSPTTSPSRSFGPNGCAHVLGNSPLADSEHVFRAPDFGQVWFWRPAAVIPESLGGWFCALAKEALQSFFVNHG